VIRAIFDTFIAAQQTVNVKTPTSVRVITPVPMKCQHDTRQCKAKLNHGGACCVQKPGMYVSSKAFIEMMVVLNRLTIPEFALR
jgi:hypothetical protein